MVVGGGLATRQYNSNKFRERLVEKAVEQSGVGEGGRGQKKKSGATLRDRGRNRIAQELRLGGLHLSLRF